MKNKSEILLKFISIKKKLKKQLEKMKKESGHVSTESNNYKIPLSHN
ncbi:MAG: hypothetical protein QXW35_05040 [Candidatus Aenigmatarchaeota archaeon]